MIAKIITHGPTRAIALSKLSQALAQTEVTGSVTNLAFLSALARHKGFGAGDVDTGLIERDLADLILVPDASARVIATAVLAAANLPQASETGFTLWAALPRTIVVMQGELEITARLGVLGAHTAIVTLTGQSYSARRKGAEWQIDGASPLRLVQVQGTIHVFTSHGSYSFTPIHALARDTATGALSNATLSPMPGLVKAVFVVPGQEVKAGDRLAVLEAMKMEHTLTAARDGQIADVLVSAGMQVEAGAALILLEPAE
jgi:3-methylcrotonyl-CoA carboxylase alpha subunit